MMACESLGIADLDRWHTLPPWQRSKWLAHTFAKVTGLYDPATKPAKGNGGGVDPETLAKIAAMRGE